MFVNKKKIHIFPAWMCLSSLWWLDIVCVCVRGWANFIPVSIVSQAILKWGGREAHNNRDILHRGYICTRVSYDDNNSSRSGANSTKTNMTFLYQSQANGLENWSPFYALRFIVCITWRQDGHQPTKLCTVCTMSHLFPNGSHYVMHV